MLRNGNKVQICNILIFWLKNHIQNENSKAARVPPLLSDYWAQIGQGRVPPPIQPRLLTSLLIEHPLSCAVMEVTVASDSPMLSLGKSGRL